MLPTRNFLWRPYSHFVEREIYILIAVSIYLSLEISIGFYSCKRSNSASGLPSQFEFGVRCLWIPTVLQYEVREFCTKTESCWGPNCFFFYDFRVRETVLAIERNPTVPALRYGKSTLLGWRGTVICSSRKDRLFPDVVHFPYTKQRGSAYNESVPLPLSVSITNNTILVQTIVIYHYYLYLYQRTNIAASCTITNTQILWYFRSVPAELALYQTPTLSKYFWICLSTYDSLPSQPPALQCTIHAHPVVLALVLCCMRALLSSVSDSFALHVLY